MKDTIIAVTTSLRDAMQSLNRSAVGIALATDAQGYLLGTITDGDIRRAILAGINLDAPVSAILNRKSDSSYPHPVTAALGTDPQELLRLMKEHGIRHIPLVDDVGRLHDLATMDALLPSEQIGVQAVIMAGGQGTRLRPLTDHLPKPMLPIGDRPLMERTIEQLRQAGIQQVLIATHYLPAKIHEYFGDGNDFGVELEYVHEDRPLGTAGALGLVPARSGPLLVINGDILTQVDFRAMLSYHREQNADLTIGVRPCEMALAYGIVECDGARVSRLREKPVLRLLVNAGVYLLEPAVRTIIPIDQRFDMTDLIQLLLDEGRPVASFPIVEYWRDIGQPSDYAQAIQDYAA